MKHYELLAGRILLAHIFVLAGLNKIGGYDGTQAYMESAGVPGMLLPVVIILEIGGGLALIAGWFTRYSAYVLAGFSIFAAVLFHSNPGDQMQMILLMKNFTIAGGLLVLATAGAGALSLDARKVSAHE
ncbi:MAG: DoxX family protein [Gammaproteobacteria bacterium]|nr:MAG: DoxX family protein [Gammaproteobacteria bacterium]